ncbi:MAG TPA: hypothetical protein VJC37_04750 [Planctomycetota bacterium]|nr:hypothetical protein [Planctomycetota bacterium]
MKTALKMAVRVVIDLIIIIAVILAYTVWQNSEINQYEKYLADIQTRSEIKIDDINAIVIKENGNSSTKTIRLTKKDPKYAFVLDELFWILKRKSDLIDESPNCCFSDYTITLNSKDGIPLRRFEMDYIRLRDMKTKACYSFYMALRIKEWFNETPYPEVK